MPQRPAPSTRAQTDDRTDDQTDDRTDGTAEGSGRFARLGRTRRRVVLAVAVTVALAATVVMLSPVLAAPVNADDRYWYLRAGPGSGGSYVGVLSWTWDELPAASQSGRLAPFASISRRLTQLATMQLAVSSGTSVLAVQAVVKLLTFGACLGALAAFLRSLRQRGADGVLERLDGRSLGFVTVATALLVAAGSQAHSQFRNGWTSYSILTWGAVVVIFGTVALSLWLTARVAARPWGAGVPAVVVLVALSLFLNLSYELVYVTAPAVLLALLLQPVDGGRRRHLAAKLVVGGSFLGSFSVFFLAIRRWLAAVCEQNECYVGVQPQLNAEALRTMAYNLVGAAPVAGGNELRADLERVGYGERWPVPVTGWSVLLAVLVVVSLLAVWATTQPRRPAPVAAGSEATVRATERARGRILVVGAVVAVAVAVGEAAVMGLSVQAADVITQPGLPYRHTMVTWTGLALGIVLLCAAAGRMGSSVRATAPRPAWWGGAGVAVLAALLAWAAAVNTPANVAATAANRLDPRLMSTEAVQWEVVLGDRDPAADDRRCEVLDRVVQTMGEGATTDSILRGAERAMQFHHGMAFCSRDS